jgi:hypothetical protein
MTEHLRLSYRRPRRSDAFTFPSTAYALYPATRRRRFISGSPKQHTRTPRTPPPQRRFPKSIGGEEGLDGASANCCRSGGGDAVVWSPRGKGILIATGAVVWRGNTVAAGTDAVDGRKGSPRAGRWRLAMERRVGTRAGEE